MTTLPLKRPLTTLQWIALYFLAETQHRASYYVAGSERFTAAEAVKALQQVIEQQKQVKA